MDFQTKVINYFSIAFGIFLGIATGVIIYRQTKIRAEELEADEQDAVEGGLTSRYQSEYVDDTTQAQPLNSRRGAAAGDEEYQDYLSDEETDDDVFRVQSEDNEIAKTRSR